MKKDRPILQGGCPGRGYLPLIIHVLVWKSNTGCRRQAGTGIKVLKRSSVHSTITENRGTDLIQDIKKEEDTRIMDITMKNMAISIMKEAPSQIGTRIQFFPRFIRLTWTERNEEQKKGFNHYPSHSVMDKIVSNCICYTICL